MQLATIQKTRLMNHVHNVASGTPNRNNAQHLELNVENVDERTILPEYVIQRQQDLQ